jgi:phosphoenolpyruvate carboxykinase (ATP)
MYRLPVFGLKMPNSCPGVPDSILNPVNVWYDKDSYYKYLNKLAGLFAENIKKFAGKVPVAVLQAGPQIK